MLSTQVFSWDDLTLFIGRTELQVLGLVLNYSVFTLDLNFPFGKRRHMRKQDITSLRCPCQAGDFVHVFFFDAWTISQVRETVKGRKPTALFREAVCWAGPDPAPPLTAPMEGEPDTVPPRCGTLTHPSHS